MWPIRGYYTESVYFFKVSVSLVYQSKDLSKKSLLRKIILAYAEMLTTEIIKGRITISKMKASDTLPTRFSNNPPES